MPTGSLRSGQVYALFLLRLALGLVFIVMGYQKFADLSGPTAMFDGLGIPLPGFTAFMVALAELGGGMGIVVGVLPRFSAAVLSIVMVSAMFLVAVPGPFMPRGWGVEMVLAMACLTIVINGAGRPTLSSVFNEPRLDLETFLIERVWRRG